MSLLGSNKNATGHSPHLIGKYPCCRMHAYHQGVFHQLHSPHTTTLQGISPFAMKRIHLTHQFVVLITLRPRIRITMINFKREHDTLNFCNSAPRLKQCLMCCMKPSNHTRSHLARHYSGCNTKPCKQMSIFSKLSNSLEKHYSLEWQCLHTSIETPPKPKSPSIPLLTESPL